MASKDKVIGLSDREAITEALAHYAPALVPAIAGMTVVEKAGEITLFGALVAEPEHPWEDDLAAPSPQYTGQVVSYLQQLSTRIDALTVEVQGMREDIKNQNDQLDSVVDEFSEEMKQLDKKMEEAENDLKKNTESMKKIVKRKKPKRNREFEKLAKDLGVDTRTS